MRWAQRLGKDRSPPEMLHPIEQGAACEERRDAAEVAQPSRAAKELELKPGPLGGRAVQEPMEASIDGGGLVRQPAA